MGAVVPFARPAKRRQVAAVNGARRITGFAVVLEARPGAVLFIADDLELGLTPEQARELARDLNESADDAEACQ